MVQKNCKKNQLWFKVTTAKLRIMSLFVMLISFALAANSQVKESSDTKVPQVELAGTQLLHLTSAITNKDYELYINLPRGYADSTKTFPVLFLIDAQWDFSLVQAVYGSQYYDGFIPEMVIVGITWGGKNPDYNKLRAYDLTPTDISHMGTYGNAPKFLSFISKELIPYIEGKYRVRQNDRTLMGSSYGGLFTLYAMFQDPKVFNRFVLTSPAIDWDNKFIYSLNKSFAERHKELDAKVFMGIGGYEDVPEFQNFINDLEAKKYKNFKLQTKVIEGMGHSGGKADGYSRGMQSVFARPDVKINPSILDSYKGKYMINPQYIIKLVQEQGKLVAITPEKLRIILNAESDVDFYSQGLFLEVHIEKDQAGKVTGLTLFQYDGKMLVQKIN
jgi:predicted alpha/beta superfamily hydrolase